MRVERITGWIGAVIAGVDLRQPIGDNLAEALRAALAEHQVLVFPDQHLDLAQQKRLTEAFGPLFRTDYVDHMADEPFVIRYRPGGMSRRVD